MEFRYMHVDIVSLFSPKYYATLEEFLFQIIAKLIVWFIMWFCEADFHQNVFWEIKLLLLSAFIARYISKSDPTLTISYKLKVINIYIRQYVIHRQLESYILSVRRGLCFKCSSFEKPIEYCKWQISSCIPCGSNPI